MIREFKVGPAGAGLRLDKFLVSQRLVISRAKLSSLIKKKLVEVNDIPKKSSYLLKAGDKVRLNFPQEDKALKPYRFLIPIVWEDKNLLVIDKPPGIAVHPHGKNKNKTVVNALLHMGKNLSGLDPNRPGVVHRLDKETSGVMVLAKDNVSHENLIEQFKNRKIKKEYFALVWGHPKNDKFSISLSLRRRKKNRLRMEVGLSDSKTAHTDLKVIKRLKKTSLLAVYPKTGRMHQIRVHLKFLGFPILGDTKYGRKDNYKNLFLHAGRITLKHPATGQVLKFKSELPQYFQKLASE